MMMIGSELESDGEVRCHVAVTADGPVDRGVKNARSLFVVVVVPFGSAV